MPENSPDFDVKLLFGPPPVLPDVEKQLNEYILCPDRLPIHDYEKAQQFWKREPNPRSIFHCDLSPLGTTLKVDRDFTTGKVLQFKEVSVEDMGCTAKNSLSLHRAPQPFNESVRGNDSNFPFLPAGFPDFSTHDVPVEQDTEIDFENDLVWIAPGFSRGIEFKADGRTPITKEDELKIPVEPQVSEVKEPKEEPSSALNLMEIMKQEEDLLGLWKESAAETQKGDKNEIGKLVIQTMKINEEEDMKVIPTTDSIPVLKISRTVKKETKKTEWAECIDITQPVREFHQKIPTMAHKFPFDLDTFQQQAILKVEEHSNVFVAAHTSAGKTVVAEYAIALSQTHKTKTIYTSPIKALSNQKFRDFKTTFGDVGLITGDIQLNQQANCLIMTTEILRSMLYQGSDVVRDLEFVIFDEVHYINNAERGHVWEEVLILLPKDVCIIMLSATVPNTLEFANWVGRTKQKKMYVISTLKRPVPLEHYLYAASGGKQKNDRFLILDGNGRFIEEGYNLAKEAKEGKKKGAMPSSAKGPMHLTPKQEATMLGALMDHLQKDERLPVIVFTLSRNRCDQNARSLNNLDLTTARQKHHIHMFFRRCLEKLKEPDRELPQVKDMEDMLMRGIGVHHSGILPILKEIVEMLFQEECVKLLFATETFAMGVNMPARTVVFDSIRKFNGVITQTLLPAEYIQMAGRAGRRGLDTSGTVIILCKKEVPKVEELKSMMLGKPEELTSQFRLTYSMILRCLRVEKISVEDMMSRSFMEFGKQSRQDIYLNEMKVIEEQMARMLSEISSNQSSTYVPTAQLEELYIAASEYLSHWADTRITVLAHRAQKELVSGRVIVVNHEDHINKLAVILKLEIIRRETKYQVLVLCHNESNMDVYGEIQLTLKNEPKKEVKKKKPDEWYKMLGLVNSDKIFVPDGIGAHTILTISGNDITEVCSKVMKINAGIIINDWQQRQQPRFRDSVPGPTCTQAVQELTQMSLNYNEVTFLNLALNKITDSNVAKKLKRQEVLVDRIKTFKTSDYPSFEEQFESVFERKELERKRDHLKYLQSDQSMKLYPDYQNKVQVLRNLGYIDADTAVNMRGRVAIKMRNHEVIITELVLRGVLSEMLPEEIAALLSALVFQQKRNRDSEEPELKESLEKGKTIIKEIEEKIRREERACGVDPNPSVSQELNFDLVNVVYDWARGEPFKHIMLQTDVQEGIIVRCIQQLHETLRDVKDAAVIFGDPVLGDKMEKAQTAIKRDIVFAASLYTTDSACSRHDIHDARA